MDTLLLEFSIRASLIAASTAAVLWALQIRTASARHAAWTAVVIAMLLLPLWTIAGLKLPVRVLRPAASVAADTSSIVIPSARADRSVAVAPASVPQDEPARPFDWKLLAIGAYLLGVAVLLSRLLLGTLQAARLRRAVVADHGRATSDRCATPITVGFLRPTLILPSSWPQWTASQLEAVLTHEREHARRRDPLVQWVALFNRALFWFHPLSWWLERRLATLAEEACDAAVLAAGHSPEEYSRYLLDMAGQITRERRRVQVVGMAMPGSGLKSRLRQILDGMPMPPISRARVTCTIVVCAISSAVFAAGTLAERQGAQDPSPGGPEKFDVVSIKPCESVETAQTGRGAGPNLAQTSPGHAYWACVTVAALIDQAYAGADFPLLNNAARPMVFEPRRGETQTRNRVRGGPSWINSDRFAIEVTAPVDTINGRGNLAGLPPAMNRALRAMLADRFQLKVRRATEEQPMYALVVAPGGLKIKAPAAGDCTVWANGMPRSPQRGEKPYCGNIAHTTPLARLARLEAGDDRATVEAMPGADRRLEYSSVALSAVAKDLATVMDRFVIDKTGVAGDFMFAVEFTADESTPGFGGRSDAAGSGPRIFQALEALGLKLEQTKGPAEYLMIDSIQKPRPDSAFAPAAAPQSTQAAGPKTFDVASIKPCTDPPRALLAKRGGLKTIANTENRLYLECITLESLADLAYSRDGEFVLNEHIEDAVRGGPDWTRSERFTLEATTTATPGAAALMGPMLRALLEDRFQLVVHRDTIEVPVYALTVARSGLKIKPMAPGDCAAEDSSNPPVATPAMFAPGKKIPCGSMRGTSRGTVKIWDFGGISMQGLADTLDADRRIIDQTGLKGDFIVHLEYERDDKVLDGVNIFAALEQQLGLKLTSAKGPHTVIVIDRVERPRPN